MVCDGWFVEDERNKKGGEIHLFSIQQYSNLYRPCKAVG